MSKWWILLEEEFVQGIKLRAFWCQANAYFAARALELGYKIALADECPKLIGGNLDVKG